MRVKVDMSVEQARVVIASLDMLSRLHMGQLDNIEFFYRKLCIRLKRPIDRKEIQRTCDEIKSQVFPELSTDSYHSISSDKIPEEARIAYDLIQVLRHAIACKEKPEGGITVDYDEPMRSSMLDFAKVEVSSARSNDA